MYLLTQFKLFKPFSFVVHHLYKVFLYLENLEGNCKRMPQTALRHFLSKPFSRIQKTVSYKVKCSSIPSGCAELMEVKPSLF